MIVKLLESCRRRRKRDRRKHSEDKKNAKAPEKRDRHKLEDHRLRVLVTATMPFSREDSKERVREYEYGWNQDFEQERLS